MLVKTMELYLFPSIAQCATSIVTFDFRCSYLVLIPLHWQSTLLMSNGCLGMLQLVYLKFLHIWNSLDRKMKSLFIQSQLTNKIIVYVKNEGINLNILVVALTYVVSCAPLQIASPFIGIFFGHLMFKAC
jgi:hypothetical protein